MKAKDKAKELVDRFCEAKLNNGIIGIYQPLAKQCALICVNQILENDYGSSGHMMFWREVKKEINKL